MSPAEEAAETLRGFGIDASAGELESRSPIDGQLIGAVKIGDAGKACTNAAKAFSSCSVVKRSNSSRSDTWEVCGAAKRRI